MFIKIKVFHVHQVTETLEIGINTQYNTMLH